MIDPLVVVGVSRIDSNTENVLASTTDNGIWIFNLPQQASDLAEQAVKQLPPKVCDSVHTVITCSSADDSHARGRSVKQDRVRPRDVMASLGVTHTMVMNQHLPNLQNIFKAEAACASGLVALDLASMIARTRNAVVLIAGVDKSTAAVFLNLFRHIGAVAAEPNNYYAPFDQRRAGFAMGEGAGMLAVTTESYAFARGLDVLAVIDSVGAQTIFTHPTSPSDPAKLEQFIRNTIANSQRNLSEFACWDAHATATPEGDQLEYSIFSNIFKDENTAISSFKSRIGHCMSGSAVIEIVNAIQNIQSGNISHNYNLEQPIADDSRLITTSASTQKKTFVKTSFGFGGRNGAVVITVQ
jgi:3-oxoacyl-(acyl-carrier-protein) synthase